MPGNGRPRPPMILMTSAGPDEKRPRLAGWNGHTHPHVAQHAPEPSTPYSHHLLPQPGSHPANAYPDPDRRQLSAASTPYAAGTGYAPQLESVPTPYPPDPAYARPGGTPIKPGSPDDAPRPLPVTGPPPLPPPPPPPRSLSVSTTVDAGPPMPPLSIEPRQGRSTWSNHSSPIMACPWPATMDSQHRIWRATRPRQFQRRHEIRTMVT